MDFYFELDRHLFYCVIRSYLAPKNELFIKEQALPSDKPVFSQTRRFELPKMDLVVSSVPGI